MQKLFHARAECLSSDSSPARQARPRNRRPETKKGEGHGPSPGKPPTQSMGGRCVRDASATASGAAPDGRSGCSRRGTSACAAAAGSASGTRCRSCSRGSAGVDDVAALVDADRLPAGVEADDRAAIVQVVPFQSSRKRRKLWAPPSVPKSAWSIAGRRRAGAREVDALAGDDRRADTTWSRLRAVAAAKRAAVVSSRVVRIVERADVVPGVDRSVTASAITAAETWSAPG